MAWESLADLDCCPTVPSVRSPCSASVCACVAPVPLCAMSAPAPSDSAQQLAAVPGEAPRAHVSFLVCGTRFDVDRKYKLIKPIGTGAYGVVWSATIDAAETRDEHTRME